MDRFRLGLTSRSYQSYAGYNSIDITAAVESGRDKKKNKKTPCADECFIPGTSI